MKIALCSDSTARDVRLRFKAGGLRGTVLERQRCKVQGNSNLLHDCAIYLFIQHRNHIYSTAAGRYKYTLVPPTSFLQKSNSNLVFLVLLKYSADIKDHKA